MAEDKEVIEPVESVEESIEDASRVNRVRWLIAGKIILALAFKFTHQSARIFSGKVSDIAQEYSNGEIDKMEATDKYLEAKADTSLWALIVIILTIPLQKLAMAIAPSDISGKADKVEDNIKDMLE